MGGATANRLGHRAERPRASNNEGEQSPGGGTYTHTRTRHASETKKHARGHTHTGGGGDDVGMYFDSYDNGGGDDDGAECLYGDACIYTYIT